MNFYNPYYMPYITSSTGLFSNLFKGINFSSILSGTQKALNFANQDIPVVKEISPMIKNAKTMFKVMNEFKKADRPSKINNKENTIINTKPNNNSPTFFA